MKVIVYAEDLSGRKDDGYYSKPNIASALDIFFATDDGANFTDSNCENELTRDEALTMFNDDRRLVFYNEDGEKVVISADSSV